MFNPPDTYADFATLYIISEHCNLLTCPFDRDARRLFRCFPAMIRNQRRHSIAEFPSCFVDDRRKRNEGKLRNVAIRCETLYRISRCRVFLLLLNSDFFLKVSKESRKGSAESSNRSVFVLLFLTKMLAV